MIDDDNLQEILARADLVALVADDVPNLRRIGQSFRGKCPFCEHLTTLVVFHENRPARWHCMHRECWQGGNAFAWLQRTRGIHFRDAVALVCRRFALPVPAGAGGFKPNPATDRCSQCGSTAVRPCGDGVICADCFPLEE